MKNVTLRNTLTFDAHTIVTFLECQEDFDTLVMLASRGDRRANGAPEGLREHALSRRRHSTHCRGGGAREEHRVRIPTSRRCYAKFNRRRGVPPGATAGGYRPPTVTSAAPLQFLILRHRGYFPDPREIAGARRYVCVVLREISDGCAQAR
jgi:hypothetical protein